jgi:hypothetical protein
LEETLAAAVEDVEQSSYVIGSYAEERRDKVSAKSRRDKVSAESRRDKVSAESRRDKVRVQSQGGIR